MKSRYYKILGLPDNAPLQEVRNQYRKMVMRYHPDKNTSPGAEKKFIEIKEAYEVLVGKQPLPHSGIKPSTRRPSGAKSTEVSEAEKRKRAAEAQARYREQQLREELDNELYYRKLTQGYRWKIMKASAIIGVILSLFLVLDRVLPHHYDLDEVTGYNLNPAHGFGGVQVSLISTENRGNYWIEGMNYSLYHGSHKIWIESSWLMHNPMRILSQDKVRMVAFPLNFTFYKATYLVIILFLMPMITILYKRRKISFTVLYFFCFYGVNATMLYYLLTENRWAHILTLGFL